MSLTYVLKGVLSPTGRHGSQQKAAHGSTIAPCLVLTLYTVHSLTTNNIGKVFLHFYQTFSGKFGWPARLYVKSSLVCVILAAGRVVTNTQTGPTLDRNNPVGTCLVLIELSERDCPNIVTHSGPVILESYITGGDTDSPEYIFFLLNHKWSKCNL